MKITKPPVQLQQMLLMLAIIVLCSAALQFAVADFIYQRNLMWQQPWRWWTGHWVHVGWRHYLLNMLALACLPFIFPNSSCRVVLAGVLLFSPLLSIGLYVLLPGVQAYAGLSGILHGIYVCAAIQSLSDRRRERQFAMLVLACIFVKLGMEYHLGYTETAELIQAPVLIESHQIGAVIGLIAAVVCWLKQTLHKIFRQTG